MAACCSLLRYVNIVIKRLLLLLHVLYTSLHLFTDISGSHICWQISVYSHLLTSAAELSLNWSKSKQTRNEQASSYNLPETLTGQVRSEQLLSWCDARSHSLDGCLWLVQVPRMTPGDADILLSALHFPAVSYRQSIYDNTKSNLKLCHIALVSSMALSYKYPA